MAFKLKSPYKVDWTPIYRTLDEDGILGVANKNGTIRVHKELRSPQLDGTIAHEKIHVDDIKNGLLWYDDDFMYHRKTTKEPWQTIKRGPKTDGDPNSAFEQKAYKNS